MKKGELERKCREKGKRRGSVIGSVRGGGRDCVLMWW